MIKFNMASITNLEEKYVLDSLKSTRICGDNKYTKKVTEKFEEKFGLRGLLVTSCSTALDMTAILCDLKVGDEVIVPSYTFVSTVNAVILRGAKPVFVDIDPKTLNMDVNKIEEKITKKTKAIYIVHYAGVACDMDKVMQIAKKYDLFVIEDAAQAIGSYYKGKILGTIGDYGCFSFHETKNIVMGEGGLLIVKDDEKFKLAEMIREKGTNRKQFLNGFVDKYTWQVPGSSYLPSDILAALLYAQLERFDDIQAKRLDIWNKYNKALKIYEEKGLINRPYIPKYATNNAHMYYIILKDEETRSKLIKSFKDNEIDAPFHYIPLHLSPMGKKYGYAEGDLPITEEYSKRLLRLPLHANLIDDDIKKVIKVIDDFFEEKVQN